MAYKSAKIYTGSEWASIAVSVADSSQRTVKNVLTTTYTPVISDAGYSLVFDNSSSVTVTIPTNTSVPFNLGQTFIAVQKGAGQVTFVGDNCVTIRSLSSNTKTSGQYAEVRLLKLATNEWLLSGDLTS